jgi:hypothetical protein
MAAAVLAKMLGIGWSEKCALMMVKPPGDARRARIFEIDNDVLIAVKQGFRKRVACLVSHSREVKFRARLEALSEKSIEDRRRRSAVEASVMKAQSNF